MRNEMNISVIIALFFVFTNVFAGSSDSSVAQNDVVKKVKSSKIDCIKHPLKCCTAKKSKNGPLAYTCDDGKKTSKNYLVKNKKAQQEKITSDTYIDTNTNKQSNIAIKTSNFNEVVGESFNEESRRFDGHPYLGIMAGIGYSNIGKQQLDTSLGVNSYNDKYLSNNSYSNAGIYGVNGGYEFKLGSSNGLLSFGVGFYQSSDYKSQGQHRYVKTFLPKDDYYLSNYNYKLQNTRFMLETQFAWQFDFKKIKLIPFVSVGAGPALNFANSYEQALVGQGSILPSGFKSNRSTSFAYQLGAGIACPFSGDNNRLFVSYKYADSGAAKFNSVDGTSYRLDVGKIRSNEVYIGYTHLFDS